MFVASAITNDEVLIVLPDGRHVVIAVMEMNRRKVWLGFDAPIDIQIHRDSHIDRSVVGGRIVRTIKPKPVGDGPRQKIQPDDTDIQDLGRRVIDPLGVAEAYEELSAEGVVS